MFEKLKAKLDAMKESSLNFIENPQILAPEDAVQERLGICKQCPEFNKAEICRACGCYIPWKTKLSLTSCPLKKWHKIEIHLVK